MKYKKLSEEEKIELQNIQELLNSQEEETRLLAVSLLDAYSVCWLDTVDCRTLKDIAIRQNISQK